MVCSFRLPGIITSTLLILSLLPVTATHADTLLSNDIVSDTLWGQAGSPYIIQNALSVTAGATLTIEPGVEVRFQYGTGLSVYGTLLAEGSAVQRILFTGTTSSAGWWSGISIIGTAAAPNNGSRFSYSTIEYGGSYYALVDITYGHVDIRDSTIQHSSQDGIYGGWGGEADLQRVALLNNTGFAVNLYDGSVNPRFTEITASGNGHDTLGTGTGTLHGDHLWESAGIPYEVTGLSITVAKDGHLQIEKGVEIRFSNGASLDVIGRLTAIGDATHRIRFTATTPTPGWWSGISIIGTGTQNSGLILDYADVEYGGDYYANIFVNQGQATISNSRLRYSSGDGLYLWYGGAASTITSSLITDNAGYGVQNISTVDPSHQLIAANNWWGNSSGPYHATCNPSGTGSSVNDGVIFTPFLTAPDQQPGPLASSDARILLIKPARWFVAADGITQALVTIGLKDGRGFPLTDRTVKLQSTLGSVFDGAITNHRGETTAYIISSTPGDARLTATLDYVQNCESARSPSATITFVTPASGNGLTPTTSAPYMDEQISFEPEPITRGVPTTVSADLTNPNNFPVTVDAAIETADFGIGQPFSEIARFTQYVIPANGTVTLKKSWTPVISGSYCARMSYSASGGSGWSSSGSYDRNLHVAPGALGSGGEKRALNLAQKYTGTLNHDGVTVGLNLTSPQSIPYQLIQSKLVGAHLNWMFSSARKISQALGGDPPRLDYDRFSIPPRPTAPRVSAGGGLSTARADAINALQDAMLNAISNGRGATISLDRYGGASAAGDLVWASRQADALLYYKGRLGADLIQVALRLERVLNTALEEGYSDDLLTVGQVKAYQLQLQSVGYQSEELAAAQALGLTSSEIQAILNEQVNADPLEVTLSRVAYTGRLAAAYRDLGTLLSTESISTGMTATKGSVSNNLARVHQSSKRFTLANPLPQSATIDLRIRRVNVPSDWIIAVVPEQVTLAAGASTGISLIVNASTPAVQGTRPRVAVEGYAGSQMIGGVTIDVLIPEKRSVGCSGATVVIPDQTVFPLGSTDCTATVSITTRNRVTVPQNAQVTMRAPTTTLSPGFVATTGAWLQIIPN